MKRIAFISLLCIAFTTNLDAKTQAGKWGLAAQLFNSSGTEIAFGKMANSTMMYLINLNMNLSLASSETESSTGGTSEGPKTTTFSVQIAPEMRTYMHPNAKISPFMGYYIMVGFGSGTTTTPTGTTTVETKSSNFSAGLGLNFGVEYFMSKHFSLSASTRVLGYSFTLTKTEAGSPVVTNTSKNHSIVAYFSPGFYIRFYY
jgi:hypothetical protein